MADWNPKHLWEDLRRAIDDWMAGDEDGEGEQAGDPSLLFHLAFTAPLVLGVLAMLRRAA
jgi:hypothetical protein